MFVIGIIVKFMAIIATIHLANKEFLLKSHFINLMVTTKFLTPFELFI